MLHLVLVFGSESIHSQTHIALAQFSHRAIHATVKHCGEGQDQNMLADKIIDEDRSL